MQIESYYTTLYVAPPLPRFFLFKNMLFQLEKFHLSDISDVFDNKNLSRIGDLSEQIIFLVLSFHPAMSIFFVCSVQSMLMHRMSSGKEFLIK